MFGADDVIYVPEDGLLIFDDVYNWRRHKIDIRAAGIGIRAASFEYLTDQLRATLDLVKHSDRFTNVAAQIEENVGEMIKELAARAGALSADSVGDLAIDTRTPNAKCWVRISDLPAESFHAEDYEREAVSPPSILGYPTFGTVHVAQLDGLDVSISGEEEAVGELPFSLNLPTRDGLTRWTMPPLEPLALIHEFCGVRGASNRGRTVNIDTRGIIPEGHQFCTPLGTLGGRLYATVYFHFPCVVQARVVSPLTKTSLPIYEKVVVDSGFALADEGPHHRIYARDGDCVHFYFDLDGKEAEDVPEMPPLLVVASAGGQFDPMNRGALFEALQDSLR